MNQSIYQTVETRYYEQQVRSGASMLSVPLYLIEFRNVG